METIVLVVSFGTAALLYLGLGFTFVDFLVGTRR